jgi:hypothetical protein
VAIIQARRPDLVGIPKQPRNQQAKVARKTSDRHIGPVGGRCLEMVSSTGKHLVTPFYWYTPSLNQADDNSTDAKTLRLAKVLTPKSICCLLVYQGLSKIRDIETMHLHSQKILNQAKRNDRLPVPCGDPSVSPSFSAMDEAGNHFLKPTVFPTAGLGVFCLAPSEQSRPSKTIIAGIWIFWCGGLDLLALPARELQTGFLFRPFVIHA